MIIVMSSEERDRCDARGEGGRCLTLRELRLCLSGRRRYVEVGCRMLMRLKTMLKLNEDEVEVERRDVRGKGLV